MKSLPKRIALLALSLSLAASAAGCSAGSTGSAPTTGDTAASVADSPSSGEKTVLTVWARDSIVKAARSAAEGFNSISDTVTVQVVEQPSTQFSDQFALALSSNEAPDIASIDCTKVPYYASIGAFVDITERYEALPFKDTFSEGMLKLGTHDGKTYTVPFAPDVSVLLYNKDHYIEAGLDPDSPPTTWEELIDYTQKLTNDDHYGYVYTGGHAGGHMFTFMPYVWNNGGEVLSEDGSTCLLDQPKAVEALQLFSDLTNVYKVTPPSVTTYSWSEAQDAFLTQKSSMIVLGSAAIYSFISGENSDLNWGAGLIPRGPSGSGYASFSGGDSIGITVQTGAESTAWEFIEYCLSEEVQVEALAREGLLPARSDLFDNEYFNATPEYQVLKQALEVGRAPYSLKYDEMYVPILEAMQKSLSMEKTPEEGFADAVVSINQIMQS